MQECSDSIPESNSADHGYLRDCYQKFMMNLDRLKNNVSESPKGHSLTRSSRRESSEKFLFQPDSIFVKTMKEETVKVKGTWKTERTSNLNLVHGKALL